MEFSESNAEFGEFKDRQAFEILHDVVNSSMILFIKQTLANSSKILFIKQTLAHNSLTGIEFLEFLIDAFSTRKAKLEED